MSRRRAWKEEGRQAVRAVHVGREESPAYHGAAATRSFTAAESEGFGTMSHRPPISHATPTGRCSMLHYAILLLLFVPASFAARPIAVDEDAPWPRVRSTNGHTVTLHLPQVERWTSNSFTARAAVEVKMAKSKTELLGVVWFDAHGSVDRSNRVVSLDRLEIAKGNFPTA